MRQSCWYLFSAIRRRTSLLYEHALSHEESSEKREAANSLMSKLCSSSDKEIRPETPELFINLVKTLKMLDSTTLQAVYTDITGPRKPCDNAEYVGKLALFLFKVTCPCKEI